MFEMFKISQHKAHKFRYVWGRGVKRSTDCPLTLLALPVSRDSNPPAHCEHPPPGSENTTAGGCGSHWRGSHPAQGVIAGFVLHRDVQKPLVGAGPTQHRFRLHAKSFGNHPANNKKQRHRQHLHNAAVNFAKLHTLSPDKRTENSEKGVQGSRAKSFRRRSSISFSVGLLARSVYSAAPSMNFRILIWCSTLCAIRST